MRQRKGLVGTRYWRFSSSICTHQFRVEEKSTELKRNTAAYSTMAETVVNALDDSGSAKYAGFEEKELAITGASPPWAPGPEEAQQLTQRASRTHVFLPVHQKISSVIQIILDITPSDEGMGRGCQCVRR